ncbi:sulfite reductase (NADPH) flavoprotein alpha-component [Gemmobacter aquatilis]|uniref:NADPH--hemoprotein reductase n=1 Tax=Gemmobacter aquatilis TaxID=933059 RepID=A0A1H8FLA6_9RHOB|nr:PepSY domain-containing protein [Gemmobacter aquatilis]SEN32390.1 sulfite reductase (NADPH) flavoprotein alpha-component [Gemmobacter aquatilis]
MIRTLHRWPGLIAALLLTVIALSGALLSAYPALDAVQAPPAAEAGLSTAELATRILGRYPSTEQIRRAPSGRITAYYYEGDTPAAATIDPATGAGVRAADTPAVQRWLTRLHRALLLGDGGRIAVAGGAGAMLILSLSGLVLVARRVGGWRRFFAPLRGRLAGRLHVEIARLAVAGLLFSSVTALWMAASTFALLPEGPGAPRFPDVVSGQTGLAPAAIATLRDTPVADLVSLTFPLPGDASDAFTLKTRLGEGYLDQGNGTLLAWSDLSLTDRLTETIYALHTGQGLVVLGLLLGLSALGVPVMAGTGLVVWLAARRGRPRLRHNAGAAQADTVLLVASEGGSTWGFAATLHAALTAAGGVVHSAPLASFAPARYAKAKRILILAATYGDGAAPASAKGFLGRLAALDRAPQVPLAVLGFGDRSFPAFCGFATAIARLAAEKGWSALMPMDTVDRQSPQDFARWGRALGATMGVPLELNHQPTAPRAVALTLISRRDYGAEMQAPTAILRFALPARSLWQRLRGAGLPHFAAGDLLGVLPEGSALPRFYSLASGCRDGFVEICVRKQAGGLCSGQLLDLQPGQTIAAFLRRNPEFRPGPGHAPVILIGAGTGVGPLAGFVRANRAGRAMHLYFGTRHPDSDFLYAEEFAQWQAEGRLASLTTAFSRGARPRHVQDALRADALRLMALVASGAQILVCGGREMAAGVSATLAEILAPAGLTPADLKAGGRYVEDVY